jgi:tyrosine-protein phosphatase SIW14
MKNIGLVPLSNFGQIVPKVYRSAQPLYEYQYAWMKNVLGIQTIVNLRSEKNVDKRFCERIGLETVTFGVKDHFSPTLDMANEFIQYVQKSDKPILIHCEHGHGRTSTFSVLTKVAHGYDVEKAIQDEKKRFHYQFKHKIQEDFVKSLIKTFGEVS